MCQTCGLVKTGKSTAMAHGFLPASFCAPSPLQLVYNARIAPFLRPAPQPVCHVQSRDQGRRVLTPSSRGGRSATFQVMKDSRSSLSPAPAATGPRISAPGGITKSRLRPCTMPSQSRRSGSRLVGAFNSLSRARSLSLARALSLSLNHARTRTSARTHTNTNTQQRRQQHLAMLKVAP